jgi:integrase
VAAGLVTAMARRSTPGCTHSGTSASWCINRTKDGGLGLPPKNVQERLGHANITITLDHYATLV